MHSLTPCKELCFFLREKQSLNPNLPKSIQQAKVQTPSGTNSGAKYATL